MEQHKINFKRTERLIDAVKVIDLLEAVESHEAVINIEKSTKEEGYWELSCEIDKKGLFRERSMYLKDIVDNALKYVRSVSGSH